MSDSRFTSAALGAIRLARESAAALGHSYVGSEHLLLGLAGQELSPAAAAPAPGGSGQRGPAGSRGPAGGDGGPRPGPPARG